MDAQPNKRKKNNRKTFFFFIFAPQIKQSFNKNAKNSITNIRTNEKIPVAMENVKTKVNLIQTTQLQLCICKTLFTKIFSVADNCHRHCCRQERISFLENVVMSTDIIESSTQIVKSFPRSEIANCRRKIVFFRKNFNRFANNES